LRSSEVYSIQHYMIKFVSDLRQVGGFLRVLWFLPPINITEILLKVVLNTIILTLTKCNDSSILITIISWDYLNLSLTKEYIGDVIILTLVIKYNQCCNMWISQSDCSIYIKLNYFFKYDICLFYRIISQLLTVKIVISCL